MGCVCVCHSLVFEFLFSFSLEPLFFPPPSSRVPHPQKMIFTCNLCSSSFLKKKKQTNKIQIEDHVKILHHKESIHYALHKSFKDTFEGNSPLLKIIDEHLLSICIPM